MGLTQTQRDRADRRLATAARKASVPGAGSGSGGNFDLALSEAEGAGALSKSRRSELQLAIGLLSGGSTLDPTRIRTVVLGLLDDGMVRLAEAIFIRSVKALPSALAQDVSLWLACPSEAAVARAGGARGAIKAWLKDRARQDPSALYGSPIVEWTVHKGDVDAALGFLQLALEDLPRPSHLAPSSSLLAGVLRSGKPKSVFGRLWLKAARSRDIAQRCWSAVLRDDAATREACAALVRHGAGNHDAAELSIAVAVLPTLVDGVVGSTDPRVDAAVAWLRIETLDLIRKGGRVAEDFSKVARDATLARARLALQAPPESGRAGPTLVLRPGELSELFAHADPGRPSPALVARMCRAMDEISASGAVPAPLLALARDLRVEPAEAVGTQVDFDPVRHDGDGVVLPGEKAVVVYAGWRMIGGVLVRHPRVRKIS